MSEYLQKVIYLSQQDYNTLAAGGNVTHNGVTLSGLEDSYIYVTDDLTPTTSELAEANGATLSLVTTGEKYIWNNKQNKMVVLEYGTSTWQDFLDAYNDNAVVYCRVDGATTNEYRMAFLAYKSSNNVEFQYYRSVNSHTYNKQGDQVFVYKLTNQSAWTTTTRETYTKIVPGNSLKYTYTNGIASQIAIDNRTVHIEKTGISSLPYTITNSNIYDNMVVVNSNITNSALRTDLSVSTNNGSVVLDGTLVTDGILSVTLDLMSI